MASPTEQYRVARDFLLATRTDYDAALAGFAWPRPKTFNFAVDWFDAVHVRERPDQVALQIIDADGADVSYTFAHLSVRSKQVARWLSEQGVKRGMRILVLLGNQVELWEVTLAAMRLGAVLVPAATLLTPADLRDRVERSGVEAVIARPEVTAKLRGALNLKIRIVVGDPKATWLDYRDSYQSPGDFEPDGPTRADEPALIYFTSGTTWRPKMAIHTHSSYPIGHLSTMYWIGLQPGDVHLNLSSPGWAKHAWSCVFAPWIAGATTCIYNYERFSAPALLDVMVRAKVTTFCAPPTVWRLLIQQDLANWPVELREVVSAGEPLNPEVIERVQQAWGLTIRDGYGQSETSVLVANTPGQIVKAGSMGRPLPGFDIELVDFQSDRAGNDGEICVKLGRVRPVGVMSEYRHTEAADDPNERAFADGRYHTGDVASRDGDGYVTYVGRRDDVFKSSDYRISPFELESVLIEHPAVAEAAVVPALDEVRMFVPKAYVTLVAGQVPSRELAEDILYFARENLAPFKRVRRLEFAELPKTISGKIRRVDLRATEASHAGNQPAGEYREEDFR